MAELYVAMADGGVGELVRVGARDHRRFGRNLTLQKRFCVLGARLRAFCHGLAQRQRNKIIGIRLQSGGDYRWHGLQHPVEIEIRQARLAKRGKANPVGRLADFRIVRDLRGVHQAGGAH